MEVSPDGETDVEAKWGRAVAQRGFAQIPNYLLMINQFVAEEHRLTPVDTLTLIHLAAAWWKADQMPFPSMATLAKRMGVSERQVQRAVGKLEKLGLLQRVKRRKSGIIEANAYDLSGLVSQLQEISKLYPNLYPRGTKEAP